jgi:hypothetical protein
MPKIQNLIAIFLILGIIYAEFLPTMQTSVSYTAYSQAELTPNQSELLLEFFNPGELNPKQEELTVMDYSITSNLQQMSTSIDGLIEDFSNNLDIVHQRNILLDSTLNQVTSTPLEDQFAIKDVLPPAKSPLFYAYNEGGKAWYKEEGKVIVMLPDETFKSFNAKTGEEIDWLQERLVYNPISSPNALRNYLTNYNGEIVAETESWALVKFPSGGFLKIAKETTSVVSDLGPFMTQE